MWSQVSWFGAVPLQERLDMRGKVHDPCQARRRDICGETACSRVEAESFEQI